MIHLKVYYFINGFIEEILNKLLQQDALSSYSLIKQSVEPAKNLCTLFCFVLKHPFHRGVLRYCLLPNALKVGFNL